MFSTCHKVIAFCQPFSNSWTQVWSLSTPLFDVVKTESKNVPFCFSFLCLLFFILIFLSFLKVPFPLEMCLSFYLSHLSDVLVMSNTSLFFVKVCQRNWKNMVDADIVISSAHLASQDLREFYISDLCYFKISNFCKIWGLMENPLSGSFNSQSKYFNFWARNVDWKYWFGFYHRQTSLFQN